MNNKECYFWPRGKYGKGPWFNPSEEEQTMIIALVGEKHLKLIGSIVNLYLTNKRYYENLSTNELNKKLFEAGEHAAALDKLLQDDIFLAYLQNKFQQFFSEKQAERLVTDPNSTFTSSAMHSDLRLISFASQLVKKRQSSTGRRTGEKKIAERQLVENLYRFCMSALGDRPTNNPNGILQKLLAILNRPLDLGGTLPGIVRQVIDERKDKKHPLKPNI